MGPWFEGEEVIGAAIPGMPECYAPGSGDRGLRAGTLHAPQGKERRKGRDGVARWWWRGPIFEKQPEGHWLHTQGEPAQLFDSGFGEALTSKMKVG